MQPREWHILAILKLNSLAVDLVSPITALRLELKHSALLAVQLVDRVLAPNKPMDFHCYWWARKATPETEAGG